MKRGVLNGRRRPLIVDDQQRSCHALCSTSVISLVGSSPLLRSGGTLLIDRTLATLRLRGFRAARRSCFAQFRAADAAAMFRPTLATCRIERARRRSDVSEDRRRDEHERNNVACRSRHGRLSRFETRFNHLAQTYIRQAWFFSDSGESTRSRLFTSSAAWAMPARRRFLARRMRLG